MKRDRVLLDKITFWVDRACVDQGDCDGDGDGDDDDDDDEDAVYNDLFRKFPCQSRLHLRSFSALRHQALVHL
eukprot:2083049-Amphidinium_carterae.1